MFGDGLSVVGRVHGWWQGLVVVCAVCLLLFLALCWYDLNVEGGADGDS